MMNKRFSLLLVALLLLVCAPCAWAAQDAVKAEKLPSKKAEKQTAPDAGGDRNAPQLLCEAYRIMSTRGGAAYQPGVDAYGRPVMPADGGADTNAYDIPAEIQIPLTLDIAQAAGLPLPTGVEGKGAIGMVSLRSDGSVAFNGKDAAPSLKSYCKTVKIEPDNIIHGGKEDDANGSAKTTTGKK